jgi:hypothetical protein
MDVNECDVCMERTDGKATGTESCAIAGRRACRTRGGKLQRRVERDGMGWQQLCKEFLGGNVQHSQAPRKGGRMG